MNLKSVQIEILTGNILKTPGDVLLLKFAQDLYNVEEKVVRFMQQKGLDIRDQLPDIGDVLHRCTNGILPTQYISVIGVEPSGRFGYKEIRNFAQISLSTLKINASSVKTVICTNTGTGFGLDEIESFKAQISGFVDSIADDNSPNDLERILIVVPDKKVSGRLSSALIQLFPDQEITKKADTTTIELSRKAVTAYSSKGTANSNIKKQHIFVAMPFDPVFDDRFHYGIQGAVNNVGYLCERADQASFTGDVLQWVKEKIETATIIIADLSSANANVYLEVGYAWGIGIPTVLIASEESELMFDVKGQRCLIFNNSIRKLEELLNKELPLLLTDQ